MHVYPQFITKLIKFRAGFQICGFGEENMSTNKLKLIALSVALVMICSVIPESESPVMLLDIVTVNQSTSAAEVWSCDFDDGNISDWSIYGIEGQYPPYTNPPGNFTTEDGVLRSNSTGEVFSIATHNSSVAYGTWSFDVDVVDTYNHEIVIPFIMIEWDLADWGIQDYFFQIVTGMYQSSDQPRLQAGKAYVTVEGSAIEWYGPYLHDDILGWKHFIITRDITGQFYFYMNGTLAFGFKDTQHTTCNEFIFSTGGGPAIDNIVVSDSVDYDAAPPEWTQEPTDQVIELGQDFRYDLNATDFSGVEDWWLNDNTNFVIDYNGVIYNKVDLEFGTYALNVSVDDTLGFTQSAVFTVSVQIPPSPALGFYVGVASFAIVIIALVVLFMKKRG
jgi:hypothetical protein